MCITAPHGPGMEKLTTMYRWKTNVAFATTLMVGISAGTTGAYARTHTGHHRVSLQGQITRQVLQADELLKNNKFDQAEALYHDALNKNNTDVSARVGLAMVYAKTFKLDRADEEFNKVLQEDPQNPSAHCGKAIIAVNRLQSSSTTITKSKAAALAQAEAECNEALKLDAKSPEANYTLGMVLQEEGQYDRAQAAFQQAIQSDKNISDAYTGLGMLGLRRNDMADAMTNFKQAIAINTGNSTAHYGMGKAYLAQGQVDDAIRELNTSLYQFRNSAPVHFELGRAYETQGNLVGAVQQYQEAVRIKPEIAAPYVHIADIRENRGDIELAISELRSGLEVVPNNAELLLRVANDNLRLEKVDDAIKDYEKVMNIAPRSTVAAEGLTRAFYLKAQRESTGAFFASNDYQNAEQSIDKAVRMNPNNLELRLAQAKLESLAGKTPDLKAIGAPQNDGERIAYAEALLAQNKFKESQEQMNYLISNTSAPKQVLALGDLAFMIKDLDSAQQAFQKAAAMPEAAERAKRGEDQVAKAREKTRESLNMANDLARKKQLASAVDKYHEAIFSNPRNAEARYGLAAALERLYPSDPKQLRECSTQYRAFLALAPSTPAKDQERIEKHIGKLDQKATKLEAEMAAGPRKGLIAKLTPHKGFQTTK